MLQPRPSGSALTQFLVHRMFCFPVSANSGTNCDIPSAALAKPAGTKWICRLKALLRIIPRGMPEMSLAAQQLEPVLLLPMQEPFGLEGCPVARFISHTYIKLRARSTLQHVLFPRAKISDDEPLFEIVFLNLHSYL